MRKKTKTEHFAKYFPIFDFNASVRPTRTLSFHPEKNALKTQRKESYLSLLVALEAEEEKRIRTISLRLVEVFVYSSAAAAEEEVSRKKKKKNK